MAVPLRMRWRQHANVLSPLTLGSALLLGATSLHAQSASGIVTGRVTDAAAGAPISGASVRAIALPARTVAGAANTGADGRFRLGGLATGTYGITVSRIGYQVARVDTVQVRAGETTTANVAMTELASRLNELVTTATRGAEPEKILESPNAISVVSAERIAERPAATVTDHLRAQPGLSISSGGIAQANIVSRGFNNAFSTSMLMLQDYRFAGVPSLRVNVPFLFTGTNEDIDRIEILQGPAAALYGPNSGNGVLHVITKSPFQSAGTILSLDGGERSFGRAALRHAGVIPGDKWAYKLSGEYFTANDFQYADPNEPARYSATDTRVPASRRGQLVQRDFDLQKYSGEARLDYRPSEDTEFITTAGYTKVGNGMEITTTFGASQVRDWSYLNLQQRFRHKKFFAQAFMNQSNAGNENAADAGGTYYLRTGIPVVDKSRVFVGQLQQGLEFGRTRVVLGGEFIGTRPATEGTINGRNDADDDINEVGGYLQTTTGLTSKLDLLLAARGDVNSRIDGAQFSPRAALVLKATPTQNFRVTFNRAFSSPASFNFFLDQFSGSTPAPGLPVQILGNPAKEGWQYARTCAGGAANGLCMRSPYLPGQLVPVSAAAAFPGLAQALPTIIRGLPVSTFGPAGEAGRAGLLSVLPIVARLRPTDAQVGSGFLDFNTRRPTSAPTQDYAPLGANFTNTYEVGYKGLLGAKVRIATDFWYQRRPADPTTQILNQGVLLNGPQLGAFLGPAIAQGLIAAGQSPAVAQATAGAVTPGLATIAAQIPVGATAFTSALYDQPYLVFSYQNASGFVNVHGADFATDVLLTPTWSLAGTYSWLSKNVFPDAPGASLLNPLAANTPTHRATTTVRYERVDRSFTGELRGRYANAFPVNSGVFNSYNIGTPVRYPSVPVNAFVDATLSYKLPFREGVRLSLSATNLLNNERPTFVGVAPMGRLVVSRLQYAF